MAGTQEYGFASDNPLPSTLDRRPMTIGDADRQEGLDFAADERTESVGSEPADTMSEGWPRDLTRRLRVLLHTSPLDGLRRSDAIRDAEFRHYDSVALALRVLDIVIDRLGLEAEADREV